MRPEIFASNLFEGCYCGDVTAQGGAEGTVSAKMSHKRNTKGAAQCATPPGQTVRGFTKADRGGIVLTVLLAEIVNGLCPEDVLVGSKIANRFDV